MKVYVDELPDNCKVCLCRDNFCCNLYWESKEEYLDIYYEYYNNQRHKDCPLKLLKDHDRAVKQHAYKKGYNDMRMQYELGDHDKQVRKEVIDKVYAVLEQAVPHDLCWSWAVIKKELNEIQGERE